MDKIINWSHKVWRVFTVIAEFFMALSALLIFVNVVTRKFFNAPIYGTTELVQYAGLIIASFALIDNEWGDGNITLTIFLDMLKSRTRYIACAVVHVIEGLTFIIVDYLLVKDMLGELALGTVTPELDIPRWLPALITAVGFSFLTLALLLKAVIYILGTKEKRDVSFADIGRIDEPF